MYQPKCSEQGEGGTLNRAPVLYQKIIGMKRVQIHWDLYPVFYG